MATKNEYLTFEKMITPVVIKILFWIVVAACVLGGLFMLPQEPVSGILMIILGPLVARIYAEILMVMFKMNEHLFEIKELLAKKADK